MSSSKLAKWLPGREVRVRRLQRKLSQAAVGKFVKRTDQTVSKWEHGLKCPDVGQMWALAANLGMDDELRDYMIQIAENEHEQNFQADRRFNALCLSMAERTNRVILKWETNYIPGIAQTWAYHFHFVLPAADGTLEQANRGWTFKDERQTTLLCRADCPQVRLLISSYALDNLRYLSAADRDEQLARLHELDALPNWEIRIVDGPYPEGANSFDIYKPGGAEFGSPPFVYAEVWDASWCIEEPDRIARYDELWQFLWRKSIPLREFLND
ncbi:Scr1 family TA system antitoxin-like transcriptional regulator [Glycomyces harbinensis]|uniref:Helix-turn-helix domain-containing protein n=1 Tax=Glycomyces harbinensis TaxID=58114 RepID=A0A1G7CF98_9ACTN|nr:Scr1 family TA system antitoxin-like transcriptional regulator [Glycomyces harbinensis]SDE37420.1 Helix-turn-helix domain-containing protein [Glycomyces harbinensis]